MWNKFWTVAMFWNFSPFSVNLCLTLLENGILCLHCIAFFMKKKFVVVSQKVSTTRKFLWYYCTKILNSMQYIYNLTENICTFHTTESGRNPMNSVKSIPSSVRMEIIHLMFEAYLELRSIVWKSCAAFNISWNLLLVKWVR